MVKNITRGADSAKSRILKRSSGGSSGKRVKTVGVLVELERVWLTMFGVAS